MTASRPIIEFACDSVLLGNIPEPMPARKVLPDWYKDIPAFTMDNSRGARLAPGMTAKKCMPMIDGMSLGYVIPLWADMQVITDDKWIKVTQRNEIGSVAEFHSPSQLEGVGNFHPTKGQPALKIINPWMIKTLPGYSTLFIPLINRFEPRFTCLGALVDTDEGRYPKQVNFPLIWHDAHYDDTVKAGTPLILAIPIRRSEQRRVSEPRALTPEEVKYIRDLQIRQCTRGGVYTNELRDKEGRANE